MAKGWALDDDLDIDNVSTKAPPPLDDGIYRFKVVSAEGELSQKGNPKASIALEVISRFGSDEPIDSNGKRSKKVYDNSVTFTKDAAWKMKQLAIAAGIEPARRNNPEAVEAYCEALVGQEVIAEVVQNQSGARIFANVKSYYTEAEAQQVLAGETPGEESAEPARPKRGKKR